MKKRTIYYISVALLPILFANCSKNEQKQTEIVTFPLKGEVVEVDTIKGSVMVAHEEIPDYMMAMTMPFKVKDRGLLRGLQTGDSINGTLAVSRTESWLETITVVGKGEAPDPQLVAGAIMSRMLKAGDSLPNNAFLNQDGKLVRFSDFRNKVVAVTFIYTRCPLPDYCIRMSNHFAKLQRILNNDQSLAGQWHLVTVSFDPKFDTPKVLKQYAKTYNADLSTWDFVTDPDSSGQSIMKLSDGLGLTYEDDDGGLIAHNLRTVLLNKEGKIDKVIQGNEWTAEEVAGSLKQLAK